MSCALACVNLSVNCQSPTCTISVPVAVMDKMKHNFWAIIIYYYFLLTLKTFLRANYTLTAVLATL